MNNSKYTNAPKIDPQTGQATLHSVDAPKTAEAALAAIAIVTPIPAQDPTPPPVQAAPAPTEKAAQAMVNEGGNSVVLDAPRAVREPSALMGTLPPAPAVHGNGAAEPQGPVVQATKPEGLNS